MKGRFRGVSGLGLAALLLGAGHWLVAAKGSRVKAGPLIEWLPSETAPSGHPSWLIEGDFILADGTRIYIPSQRTAHAGWGRIGSTHLVSPEKKSVPVALELKWFSPTERQSWAAQIDLPVERIRDLLTTPLINPLDGRGDIPDRLIVGLAPGGDVALWAAGINGTVEVGMWQAQPTVLSMPEVIGEGDLSVEGLAELLLSENLSDEARAQLIADGPQPGLWRARAQRFVWSPELAGAPGRGFDLQALNGERLWLSATPASAPLAAPERMDVYWTSPQGERLFELQFDPTESLAAFQRLSEGLSDRPLRLTLALTAAGDGLVATLTDGHRHHRFQHLRVTLYSV